MTDSIIKKHDNDFIRDHVTDDLYKQIVSEITTRKKKSKTGKKITLTAEMLRQFLFYVSMGELLKTASEYVGLSESTRQKYANKSDTFVRVTRLAQTNVSRSSRMAIARAIMGTKPGYHEIRHPATGKPAYIEIKGTPPDTRAAMWWLEVVDKIGGEDSSETPKLGAPQTPEEVELMEQLLNKHYDYVNAKKQRKSTARES